MTIKAGTLKNNEAQKKAIAKDLSAILAHIDDEIKVAHEQGNNKVSVSLPITFSVPYMKNTDAQRMIYYKVLTSLIDRDFKNTEIELKKNATIFHISWLSPDELHELELQNTILAKYTKKDIHDIE